MVRFAPRSCRPEASTGPHKELIGRCRLGGEHGLGGVEPRDHLDRIERRNASAHDRGGLLNLSLGEAA
jgi:hypothetical protein